MDHEIKIPTQEELEEIRRQHFEKFENEREVRADIKARLQSDQESSAGKSRMRRFFKSMDQDLTIVAEENSSELLSATVDTR